MRDILWRMAGFTTEPPMAQTVVMGTVRRVWWVVAMLAAGLTVGVIGAGLGERALLSIGLAVLVLPLFAALATGRARYRIRCLRKIMPTRVPAGQQATVSLRLENISRLPTGLLLAEDTVP